MEPNTTSHNPAKPANPERQKPVFRMDTKSFLLTYSQCPLSREAVRDHVQYVGPLEKGVIG